MTQPGLPDYASLLASYHAAFGAELAAMVGSLPIREGDRVLELACGDGAYTPLLAGKVGRSGLVVGLDLSTAFLDQASRSSTGLAAPARFVAGSVDRMPFADGGFDASWCAQSLFSLPDPVKAVRSMARAVRPGGLVAVLEDDTLHQVLLPWPVEVELAVRAAQYRSLAAEVARPGKFYVGRRLLSVFHRAGLVDRSVRTFAADRASPLDPSVREFLRLYLANLRNRTAGHLEPRLRAEVAALTAPESPGYLPDQPDFAVTVIDRIVQGRRPPGLG